MLVSSCKQECNQRTHVAGRFDTVVSDLFVLIQSSGPEEMERLVSRDNAERLGLVDYVRDLLFRLVLVDGHKERFSLFILFRNDQALSWREVENPSEHIRWKVWLEHSLTLDMRPLSAPRAA